uniref:Pentatricopeptide repeat-containing protein n=1 Tax=Oryza barthii TaxID=65489 RepID=A0A0D3FSX3_9ORYZ
MATGSAGQRRGGDGREELEWAAHNVYGLLCASLPESVAGHAVATPRSPSRRPSADAADEGEVHGLSSAAAVWMGAQVRSGCEGNAESMAVALSACPYAGDLALAKGEATHGCGVVKGVIHGYVFITNSLVCMYGKLGEMDNAKKAFRDAMEKNIVTWNTLITSYATARLCDEALDVLAQMEQIGGTVAPNVVSWSVSGKTKNCSLSGKTETEQHRVFWRCINWQLFWIRA